MSSNVSINVPLASAALIILISNAGNILPCFSKAALKLSPKVSSYEIALNAVVLALLPFI